MSITTEQATLEQSSTIFQVVVCTDATVSTTVNVAASSPDIANEYAIQQVKNYGAVWSLDDDSIHHAEAYLPDESSTEPLSLTEDSKPSPVSQDDAIILAALELLRGDVAYGERDLSYLEKVVGAKLRLDANHIERLFEARLHKSASSK